MTMALKPRSEYPPWSQEGMIHWLYDRCERRLEKAVVKQDPFKTNQYLARQGILSGLLAYLESAMEGQPEMVQQMLEDITDLSSDEDSPTVNTGGYCMPSTQDTLLELPQLLCMVRQQLSCAGVTQKAQKAVEMKSSPLRLWCWPCGHWRWEPTHGSGYASRFALCTSHRMTWK